MNLSKVQAQYTTSTVKSTVVTIVTTIDIKQEKISMYKNFLMLDKLVDKVNIIENRLKMLNKLVGASEDSLKSSSSTNDKTKKCQPAACGLAHQKNKQNVKKNEKEIKRNCTNLTLASSDLVCPMNGQWEKEVEKGYNWFSHSMTTPTGQEGEEYSWFSHRRTPRFLDNKVEDQSNKGCPMNGQWEKEEEMGYNWFSHSMTTPTGQEGEEYSWFSHRRTPKSFCHKLEDSNIKSCHKLEDISNKSCPMNGQWVKEVEKGYNWFSHSMTTPTGQEGVEYSWFSHRRTPWFPCYNLEDPNNKCCPMNGQWEKEEEKGYNWLSHSMTTPTGQEGKEYSWLSHRRTPRLPSNESEDLNKCCPMIGQWENEVEKEYNWFSHSMTTPTDHEGEEYSWLSHRRTPTKVSYYWAIKHKVVNKAVKMTNGNRNMKALKIMHWNMGSKYWVRKQEVLQATMDEHKPDIMYITEANLFLEDPDYSLVVEGYKLVKPKTWENPDLEYARIVMLIKTDISFELLADNMDHDISTIWVKIIRKGNRKLIVGGLYREHRHLKQNNEISAEPRSQDDRWRRTLAQWTAATAGCDSIVIGDTNLDHNKWNQPEQAHKNMVEATKMAIETKGFIQLIEGCTRFWPGVDDSLLDHCWSNFPQKVLNKFNITDSTSDHNIIGVTVRVKGMVDCRHEFKKRKWTNFSQDRYIEKISQINWNEMYSCSNVNLAWDFFETNIKEVLSTEAPILKVQPRGSFKSWVSNSTKEKMKLRDTARDKAKATGDVEKWIEYRKLRNQVTKDVKNDRRKHFSDKYDECDVNNDVAKLYKIAKQQLGWNMNGPPTTLIQGGRTITSPQQLAQTQMEYYHSKNLKLLESVQETPDIDPLETLRKNFEKWRQVNHHSPRLDLQEITAATTANLIKKLGDS